MSKKSFVCFDCGGPHRKLECTKKICRNCQRSGHRLSDCHFDTVCKYCRLTPVADIQYHLLHECDQKPLPKECRYCKAMVEGDIKLHLPVCPKKNDPEAANTEDKLAEAKKPAVICRHCQQPALPSLREHLANCSKRNYEDTWDADPPAARPIPSPSKRTNPKPEAIPVANKFLLPDWADLEEEEEEQQEQKTTSIPSSLPKPKTTSSSVPSSSDTASTQRNVPLRWGDESDDEADELSLKPLSLRRMLPRVPNNTSSS